MKSVYLFPMSNGLDQYLANRLTNAGVVQVVTDPKKADAVFTDRLGQAFEDRLNEIFPPPKPPKKEEEKDAKKAEGEKTSDASRFQGSAPASNFSRGKGNVFLVDVKSRAILWSVYERAKDSSPKQVDGAASRVVKAFQDMRAPKPK